MKPRSLLDSYAMLMLLNQEPGYETIQRYLNEAQRDVHMSAINVGEVYYIVHRERGSSAADQFLTLLTTTAVVIQVPTLEDILAAAKVKATMTRHTTCSWWSGC